MKLSLQTVLIYRCDNALRICQFFFSAHGDRNELYAFRGRMYTPESASVAIPSWSPVCIELRRCKKIQTSGDWEGEVPAEPHGVRTGWGDGSPGGSPSQFFHNSSRITNCQIALTELWLELYKKFFTSMAKVVIRTKIQELLNGEPQIGN
ncbi:MAG: hypothetical protein DMG06_02260 [Acidobacteria bacterium]|nr:MAG: hypothetical protein DMG06_02260 [Acidobacteriota bacterium]